MSLEFLSTLWITLYNRPYVLMFLLSYLMISSRLMGWSWTGFFLILGYSIAFLSEFLSINFGIPYGWYFYKYENLKGEWLNHGVPVWDSVSYVFMNFAGLTMARLEITANKPWIISLKHCQHDFLSRITLKTILKAAFLTMLLDVVVDPVAHLGKDWFLGDIYYYPNPGFYFDVTLANFLGWFVTCFAICGIGTLLSSIKTHTYHTTPTPLWIWASVGLYYGIMGFGMAIAVYLDQWGILSWDIFWLMLTVWLVWSPNSPKRTMDSHG